MTKCTYCGRENEDDAANCRECGTVLREVPAPSADSQITPEALAAKEIEALFKPFVEVTSISPGNPFLLFIEFIVGGWIFILISVVIGVPSILVGLLLYPLFIKKTPQKSSEVKCDLCDNPAVGYKDIEGTSGFLHLRKMAWARGFFCEAHTQLLVNKATKMNLIGMFCFIGGFALVAKFARAKAQRTANISIIPKFAGDPVSDSTFDIALKLFRHAKEHEWRRESKVKQLKFADEFFLRSFLQSHDEAASRRALVYHGLVLVEREAMLDIDVLNRESKSSHAKYLKGAEDAFTSATQYGTDLEPALAALVREARSKLEEKSAKVSRRWF